MKIIVIEIKIVSNGGVMNPADLPTLSKRVEEILSYQGWDALVGISGRMPVWAYAALTEKCHPAKGVATYEPRSNGLIIVSRHSEEVPGVGEIVPLTGDEVKVEVEI